MISLAKFIVRSAPKVGRKKNNEHDGVRIDEDDNKNVEPARIHFFDNLLDATRLFMYQNAMRCHASSR